MPDMCFEASFLVHISIFSRCAYTQMCIYCVAHPGLYIQVLLVLSNSFLHSGGGSSEQQNSYYMTMYTFLLWAKPHGQEFAFAIVWPWGQLLLCQALRVGCICIIGVVCKVWVMGAFEFGLLYRIAFV